MSEKNGTAPRIQRREKWVDLPDEYEGFRFKIWVNAPTKYWMALAQSASDDSAGQDGAIEALQKIVLEHNGWLNFDGEPFPPAAEAVFWEEIPTELAACMIVAAQMEQSKLPNSMAPRRRR